MERSERKHCKKKIRERIRDDGDDDEEGWKSSSYTTATSVLLLLPLYHHRRKSVSDFWWRQMQIAGVGGIKRVERERTGERTERERIEKREREKKTTPTVLYHHRYIPSRLSLSLSCLCLFVSVGARERGGRGRKIDKWVWLLPTLLLRSRSLYTPDNLSLCVCVSFISLSGWCCAYIASHATCSPTTRRIKLRF